VHRNIAPEEVIMGAAGWVVVVLYFCLMVGIGWWAKSRVHDARDYFTAGGRMPWWLAGISHHMSGYSAAVFVAYAAVAYTVGFALYVWWALGVVVALVIGAALFAPRWPRLRQRLGIVSPMEYLTTRYNLPAQQVLAWSGTALKLFDVAAKWAACAVLLNIFASVPIQWGVLLTGGVALIYSTIGGLWADALTDLGQFVIQLVAGITMFVVVLSKLGGFSSIWNMWGKLPPSHSHPFAGSYTAVFFLIYILVDTVSYNGGTWNLAQRFIASDNGAKARRAALLSAGLYLVWPLILFFPMWAAPIILPNLSQPDQSYGLLTTHLLPGGLIGLVLAGMFSHTMAMSSSDANAISSVVVRDIIPAVMRGRSRLSDRAELAAGRIATFIFVVASLGVAMGSSSFGGVLGLLVLWFGALIGPVAIPMLLGMLPLFRRCGPSAAILSWAAGLIVFVLTKYAFSSQVAELNASWTTTVTVAGPILVSLLVFSLCGVLRPWRNAASDELVEALNTDLPAGEDRVVVHA
jgi:solute:Na+ symporter, SSS family